MTLPVYTPPPKQTRRERFAEWRGTRPFWGGVFTLVSGIYMWGLTAAPVGVVVIQGIGGISAIVIALVFIVCVLATWSQPQLRTVTGGIVIVLSLAAIVLTNLGGFLVGTLLGLHGGATMIAWKPFVKRWSRPEPAAATPAASGQVAALVAGMSATGAVTGADAPADGAVAGTQEPAGARTDDDLEDPDALDDYSDVEDPDDAAPAPEASGTDGDGADASPADAADGAPRPAPSAPAGGMTAGMTILPAAPPAGPAPSGTDAPGPQASASYSSVIR